jgi:uncharacterized protein
MLGPESMRVPLHGSARCFRGLKPSHSRGTLLGFLRLTTTPRLFARPLELDEAISIVGLWLARDNVVIVGPSARHWQVLKELLPNSRPRGCLIMDAHLAALAIEHGATLCTNDRDFLRFPGLKVEFPIQ